MFNSLILEKVSPSEGGISSGRGVYRDACPRDRTRRNGFNLQAKGLNQTQRRIPSTRMGSRLGSCSEWRLIVVLHAAPPRDTALTSVLLFESSRYSRSFSPSRRHGRRLGELERPALEQVQQLEQLRSCLGVCCLEPVSEAETSTGGSREVQNLVVRDPDTGG